MTNIKTSKEFRVLGFGDFGILDYWNLVIGDSHNSENYGK